MIFIIGILPYRKKESIIAKTLQLTSKLTGHRSPPVRQTSVDCPAVPLLDDLIIPQMNRLIAVVGASGVGKTAFVRALSNAHAPARSALEGFSTAYEGHAERPFQTLFKND